MNILLIPTFIMLAQLQIGNTDTAQQRAITTSDAVYFGIIQGVTEYLPISSTGHLILSEQVLSKRNNNHQNSHRNANNAKIDHQPAAAVKSYFAIIQFGSVLAVLFLFPKRIKSMLSGLRGMDAKGSHLVKNIAVSFLPATVVGVLIDGWLQDTMYGCVPVAIAQLVGAAIILFSEKRYEKNIAHQYRTIDDITTRDSLVIGLWQCLALFPGMSRSMTTIVGGYQRGLSRKSSAEYSFLLGLVTLTAATMFKLVKDFDTIFSETSVTSFIVGILVAFLSSSIAIKFLVSYLSNNGLRVFAYYRAVLALVIFLLS